MRLIPFLTVFVACNQLMWEAAEDAVIGEIKVAEQVVQDLTGSATQQAPDVMMPIKKF